MPFSISNFIAKEHGAITVDWTVISSAAVGLAIATAAIMTDSIDVLEGRMDDELRTRQMNDDWISFIPAHFEDILQTGEITEEYVDAHFGLADQLMNHDIMDLLEAGIADMEAGTLTANELIDLLAIASVAHQRNIVDDAVLDSYFGFDGSDPAYLSMVDMSELSMEGDYTATN